MALAIAMAYRAQAAETAAAPATPAATGSAASAVGGGTPGDYVIQVDDLLTVDDGKPRGELNTSRGYRVDGDGTIKLIHIGRVKAAGLTKRELEDRLEKLYDPKYFKNLTINVEVATKTFSIGGEVRIPGVKNFLMKTTILQAIMAAGWFTDYAKVSKVIVLRNNEKGEQVRHEIDSGDIVKGKAEDFIIKPNDIIIVPEKGWFK